MKLKFYVELEFMKIEIQKNVTQWQNLSSWSSSSFKILNKWEISSDSYASEPLLFFSHFIVLPKPQLKLVKLVNHTIPKEQVWSLE